MSDNVLTEIKTEGNVTLPLVHVCDYNCSKPAPAFSSK